MKKYIFLFLIITFSFATNVLILNSYSVKLKWTSNELEGILNELKNRNLNIYIEFMDTKILRPTLQRLKNLYDYLVLKYKKIPFDIVIVTDDNALNFVRDHLNSPIFNNSKIFFVGINNLDLANVLDKHRYAGVFEKKEPLANLNFAERIGYLKTFYVVGDNSNSAKL
jgi:hypothetical protein